MKIPTFFKLMKRTSRLTGWFSVCLSKRGIHFAQIKYVGKKPQVALCDFYPAHEITPLVLEKWRKDLHLGEHQFTTLLVPGEYQLMMVDAPNVPPAEMKSAIRWKIKEMLNYSVEDATVDVLQIPGKFGGSGAQSMYAIAAENEVVKKYMALFEKAKIPLLAIDIPEMAQRNIATLYEQPGRGLVVLSFTDGGGLMTFTCDGELYLARRIDITLGQLLDADYASRQQYLERVELEVQRSLDYFDRQFHHVPVSRLIVSAPLELGLVTLLAGNLGLPVESLDLSQVLDVSAVSELGDSEFLSHALHPLGAALRKESRAQ